MGYVMQRVQRAGQEIHVARGKVDYFAGEEHEPRWGEWQRDPPGPDVRPCLHPDCDLEDSRRDCPGNDPTCPCLDGDACHYEDLPGSPAMGIRFRG